MRTLAIVFLCIMSLSSVVSAQRVTPAQRHYDTGDTHFAQGRFAEAATEFQAAYDISHNAALLYNIARSHERAGNVDAAIETYQRFLEAGAPGTGRTEIEDAIRSLESSRTPTLPTTVVRPPTPPAPPVGPTNNVVTVTGPHVGTPPIIPVTPRATMSALHRFGPWVTVGVGALISGVSIQQGAAAAGNRGIASEAASGQRPYTFEVQEANASFPGEATRSIILGVAGGAALTAGVLWLALRHNPGTERPPVIQPVIGLNQLGLAGTF